MVTVEFDRHFEKQVKKISDKDLKSRVKNQIIKIVNNPALGKPMKYSRKGTREVYISPFRLSYTYIKTTDTLVFLELYHKDAQ